MDLDILGEPMTEDAYRNVKALRDLIAHAHTVPTVSLKVQLGSARLSASGSVHPVEDPLPKLSRAVDALPGPGVRKRLKKFLVEEKVELLDLRAQNRGLTVWWRKKCAWGVFAYYVIEWICDGVARPIVKHFRIGGDSGE
jgi:hypothetical protein